MKLERFNINLFDRFRLCLRGSIFRILRIKVEAPQNPETFEKLKKAYTGPAVRNQQKVESPDCKLDYKRSSKNIGILFFEFFFRNSKEYNDLAQSKDMHEFIPKEILFLTLYDDIDNNRLFP